MRPAGEIRTTLLRACHALATDQAGPTLRELAAHAQVAETAAKRTLDNMHRAGVLDRLAGKRRVAYRNRPVAEYRPRAGHVPPVPAADPTQGLARVLTAWVG